MRNPLKILKKGGKMKLKNIKPLEIVAARANVSGYNSKHLIETAIPQYRSIHQHITFYLNEKIDPEQTILVEAHNTVNDTYESLNIVTGEPSNYNEAFIDFEHSIIFLSSNYFSNYDFLRVTYYGIGTVVDWERLLSRLVAFNTWQFPIEEFKNFTIDEPDILHYQANGFSAGYRWINTDTGNSSLTSTPVQENFIYEIDQTGVWREYSPEQGQIIYNKNEDKFYKYNGTTWEEWSIGGSGDSLWSLVSGKLFNTDYSTTPEIVIGHEDPTTNETKIAIDKNDSKIAIGNSYSPYNNTSIIGDNIEDRYTGNIANKGNEILIGKGLVFTQEGFYSVGINLNNNQINQRDFAFLYGENTNSSPYDIIPTINGTSEQYIRLRGTAANLYAIGVISLKFKFSLFIVGDWKGEYELENTVKLANTPDPNTNPHAIILTNYFTVIYEESSQGIIAELQYDSSEDSLYIIIRNMPANSYLKGVLDIFYSLE